METVGQYWKLFIKEWKTFFLTMTGLIAIANTWNKFQQWFHFSWWVWLVFVALSANVAQFLVWKEQRNKFAGAIEALRIELRESNKDLRQITAYFKQNTDALQDLTRRQ